MYLCLIVEELIQKGVGIERPGIGVLIAEVTDEMVGNLWIS